MVNLQLLHVRYLYRLQIILFKEAVKYVNGDTKIDEKKVYLDSHLVSKDEAEKTLKEWQ